MNEIAEDQDVQLRVPRGRPGRGPGSSSLDVLPRASASTQSCCAPEEQLLADLDYVTRAFDDIQWPAMLTAAAICPGLREISTSCPSLAFMLAHYRDFVFCPAETPWQPVARRLGWRRRDLLAWLGWEPREANVRLVAKVAMPGLTVEDMKRLRDMSTKAHTVKLLRHLPSITADVIRILADSKASDLVTYQFLEDVATLDSDTSASKLLGEVIRLAELHGARLRKLRDYGQVEMHYLLLGEAEYGVVAEWDPRYESVLMGLPPSAPTIPRYTQPSGVHLEEFVSARDLYDWARDEHNCAFSMIDDIVQQRRVLLKVFEPVRGTLSLVPHDDSWRIEEYHTARNRPVPHSAILVVAAYLNKRLAHLDDKDEADFVVHSSHAEVL